MKQKIISIIMTITMALSILSGVPITANAANAMQGSGTEESPYLINNLDALKEL